MNVPSSAPVAGTGPAPAAVRPPRKVRSGARQALADLLHDGMTVMSGGFGICGIPTSLIEAVRDSGVRDLTIVSNNGGTDGIGLGLLIEAHQVRRMVSSYVGENRTFAAQLLGGDLEVEFVPQGSLAERIRAAGAGIPAFFTRTGVGTVVAEGKETRIFDGHEHVMELAIEADLALVHAHRGDTAGNLAYRMTARNFNPLMATAARVTVAEVEHLVAPGDIAPEEIATPGIFVDRLVEAPAGDKPIEQRTTRPRTTAGTTEGH